jgi:hypothetical protein
VAEICWLIRRKVIRRRLFWIFIEISLKLYNYRKKAFLSKFIDRKRAKNNYTIEKHFNGKYILNKRN